MYPPGKLTEVLKLSDAVDPFFISVCGKSHGGEDTLNPGGFKSPSWDFPFSCLVCILWSLLGARDS